MTRHEPDRHPPERPRHPTLWVLAGAAAAIGFVTLLFALFFLARSS